MGSRVKVNSEWESKVQVTGSLSPWRSTAGGVRGHGRMSSKSGPILAGTLCFNSVTLIQPWFLNGVNIEMESESSVMRRYYMVAWCNVTLSHMLYVGFPVLVPHLFGERNNQL
jgi:hypothetical protein